MRQEGAQGRAAVTALPRAASVLMAFGLLLMTGCSSGPSPVRGVSTTPKQIDAASYRAAGIPTRFGDTRPTDWHGMDKTLSPSRLGVHGIDAARYQGFIDFDRARQAGVSFAWLKATEGGDHADPAFVANANAARRAGLPVGAYHFYYFCRTPQEQAMWFIQNVPRARGDLPPVLDMEWNHLSRTCTARPDAETVKADIRTFASIIARHYGTTPVIYTTPDFYAANDLGSLSGYEFWLRSVAKHPSERYPGESWTFWQYSGTGVVPGVGGNVDLNAFAGSPRQWAVWYATRSQG